MSSHILDTNLSSRQLILDVRDATVTNGTMLSQATFTLSNPITVPEWAQVLVSVETAVIPVSFFVVNSTNNWFDIGGDEFTIAEGNPNAYELVDAINTALAASEDHWYHSVVFSYNSINNKVTIKNLGGLGHFKGPLLSLLGFDPSVVYYAPSPSEDLTSPFVVNLSGTNYVFVESNLTNASNLDSATGCSQSNVLSAVPIDQPYGSVVTYTGGRHKSLIATHQISEVRISILDENRNPIDFFNQPWFLVVTIDFVTQKDMSDFFRSTLKDFFSANAKDIFPDQSQQDKAVTK